MEFYEYFVPVNIVKLENISYESLPHLNSHSGQVKMNCKDTIVAQLKERGVKINFNRKIEFEPETAFTVSVTYSVFLPFREEKKHEMEWKAVDLAGEFRRAGGPVLTKLMSKTSLMIAEITDAADQNPLITPPAPGKNS